MSQVGPGACRKGLVKHCPLKNFTSYTVCLACTRKHESSPNMKSCKPKQRQGYCNGTAPDSGAAW